jgi:hypothetical protein
MSMSKSVRGNGSGLEADGVDGADRPDLTSLDQLAVSERLRSVDAVDQADETKGDRRQRQRPKNRSGLELAGSVGKAESLRRVYPPDYVSIETLAYRLDCSLVEVKLLLGAGALPAPATIGGLQRWDFGLVRATIESENARSSAKVGRNGQPTAAADPYLAGVESGKTG